MKTKCIWGKGRPIPFFYLKVGGGGLEDFENKIAPAQAGKQISCRAQTYINPLQHLSDMDSKKKVYMTVLPRLTYTQVRASLLPSSYPTLVLTLGFTYPLCSDMFDSTPQFCLYRAVYVWWIHQQQCQAWAQMPLSFATDNLVLLSFSPEVITSAEREVKDSRRSGMYQSCHFLTRLGKQSL